MCWWNSLQLLRLLADPGDDAGRTDQRGAEQIAQRLRGPVLGDELLDIEIDRRRLDALAILHRRDHAIGKPRPGLAPAIFAAVDRGLMFRDHERALGKIEHLAFLTPVADFGPRDEPQRPQTCAVCSITQSGSATCRNVPPLWPLWPFCPPLGRPDAPRRLPGTRGFAFNPSLEGGRELFELSCPNCRRRSATSASSAAIWRFSEAINSSTSTGRTMPPVNSDSPPAVSKDQPTLIRLFDKRLKMCHCLRYGHSRLPYFAP